MRREHQIKLSLLMSAAALFSVACGKGDKAGADAATQASASAAPAEPSEVAVGKEIVAAMGPNSFTAGKVTAIEGSKVTYEYGEPDKTTNKRPTASVDKAKAFVVGVAPKAPPQPGDHVVGKVSTYWAGCEVKNASAGVLACEDATGRVNNVDPKQVVVPDAVTSADIKQSLARAAKFRAFDAAARAAGKPVAPKGWKPKPKEAVVVAFAGASWYGGTVEKIEGEKVTIKWDSTVWKEPAQKLLNELVPLPKGAQAVKAGDFVIVQPKFAGSAWDYRKVVSVTKDSAEVIDKSDAKSTVSLKELIPIAP